MPSSVKVGSQWRSTKSLYDKIGGTWRPVAGAWRKVGGTWRKFYEDKYYYYFEKYMFGTENIISGSYGSSYSIGLQSSVANGAVKTNTTASIGWKIKNIPAGSTVRINFSISMNKADGNSITVSDGTFAIDSLTSDGSYGFDRTYTGVSNFLNVYINFRGKALSSVSMYLAEIWINGERILPIIT